MPVVVVRRGEDVDLRWWRGWRCLGERERRRRGLGVEDGYGQRGEREGEVDMGRRWRAQWRPGERERWWRGLGLVDGYGWRGGQGAWRGVWGEGEVDVGRQWRAWLRRGEREWWWRGLGVGVLFGWWEEGEGDMGRRWRSWWCPGGRERQERGPGGSWWQLGERERCEWVVEARWECGRRGRVCRAGGSGSAAVCGTGPHRSSRASPEASAPPGGPRAVPPGTWGGGGPPSSMDPPRRGVVAAVVGGMGRVAFFGGVGPGGPLWPSDGGRKGQIRFLVWGWWLVRGGWLLAVGGVCGWSARWLPSRPLLLFVHGGLWPGGVGRWAVVVVGVVLVVVVVGPLVVVVWVVVGLVLRVWPMDPLWVFRSPLSGWGAGHCGQSPGLHYVVGMGEGLGAGLDGDGGRGVPRPWVGLAGGGGGFGGWMTGRLVTGMRTRAWTGSCLVAVSAVVVGAGGRGARVAVGGGSWLEQGPGRGWCRVGLCRCVCGVVWGPAWVWGRVRGWGPVCVWGRVWGWGPVPG